MAASELGWGRRRLGHRGTRILGCGYRFVDLLGSIDVDAEAEAAHAPRGCSRSRLTIGGQLLAGEQRQ
jgi:hypothetical protein